ncbi:MAG: DNA/RNA non-specific endonuclease [Acidobacteria bacterium]|nr:DNA/RNA non-specific endonuclease [Acidobacteriota bacterium]
MMTVLLFATLQILNAQPGRFGLPACNGPQQQLAERPGFVLCFDSSRNVPTWAAYELKPEHLAAPSAPRHKHFRRDTELGGPSDSDYKNSGFSRGHAVPAADLAWNPEALQASFLLSNAIPQNPSLNSGKWRLLEKSLRRIAARSDAVIIFTGPVFCESTAYIGRHTIAVPCRLFKVAIAVHDSQLTAFAAVLPNDSNPAESLNSFATSIRQVELATGLDFLEVVAYCTQSFLSMQRVVVMVSVG